MPFYEVSHIVPLTIAQRNELAEAITTIHSTTFSTPRLFVTVRFVDTRELVEYSAGRRRNTNAVRAHVRAGPSRKADDWESLCRAITAAWDRIVPLPKVRRADPDLDYTLHACMVLGDITASFEAGFMVPPAGADVEWLREHWEEFQAKAEAGDELFRDLVDEVTERKLLDRANSAVPTTAASTTT